MKQGLFNIFHSISSSHVPCLSTIDYSIIMQYRNDALDIKKATEMGIFTPIFISPFPSSQEVDIASTK